MSGCELVVIGASWGGLHAVGEILARLPADFPVPVLVVQHRSDEHSGLLANLLNRAGPLPVVDVEDKAPLSAGCIRVAPPGYHVLVEPGHLALSTDAAVRFSRPSIDVAMASAADTYGRATIGIVLTGANQDGAAGLAAIRRRGGVAIVQDPETAERRAMPAAALAAARPQVVAPVEKIGPLLVELVCEKEARPS